MDTLMPAGYTFEGKSLQVCAKRRENGRLRLQ
jgi:hypothetical protein